MENKKPDKFIDPFRAVPISGNYLQEKGWEKDGFTWKLKDNVLIFDGTRWLLNGSEKVQHIQDLPK